MPKSSDYALTATFAGVDSLQAAGSSGSGNSLPNGIGDSLSFANGWMRALVRDTDPETFLGQRSEITAPVDAVGERWYTWQMVIPTDWNDAKIMSVMQIHDTPDGGDGSKFPNFLLTIENGQFVALVPSGTLPTETANGTRKVAYPLVKGREYSMCLHVSWQTGATGFRELFINRVPAFREFNVPTHYSDTVGPYLKLGVYDFYHSGGFGAKYADYRNAAVWTGNDGYTTVLGDVPVVGQRLVNV